DPRRTLNMVENNRIAARLRTSVVVGLMLIAVSLSVRGQSPAPATDSPGKAGSGQTLAPIGQSPGGPAFSLSSPVPVPDFLVEPGEPQARQRPSSGGARTPPARRAVPASVCKRTIHADVVAIAQPFMLNRLGAAMPNGLIFALSRDVIIDNNGNGTLKDYK